MVNLSCFSSHYFQSHHSAEPQLTAFSSRLTALPEGSDSPDPIAIISHGISQDERPHLQVTILTPAPNNCLVSLAYYCAASVSRDCLLGRLIHLLLEGLVGRIVWVSQSWHAGKTRHEDQAQTDMTPKRGESKL